MVTIPSQRVYDEINKFFCTETFCFDYDINGVLMLYLKLSPKMIISVLNGVSIKFIFRNPNIEKNSISLYIEDVKNNPFYLTKYSNYKDNSIQNNLLPGIEEFNEYLNNRTFIRVSVFDYLFKHIYTNDVDLISPIEDIVSWHERILKLSPHPSFDFDSPIENENTGYAIRLKPIIMGKTTKYTNIKFKSVWNEKTPYIVSTNRNDEFFDIANYIKKGYLGYYQEMHIKEILSNYFEPNTQLFSSIKLCNMAELTDFVILFQDVTVLIESKVDSAFDKYPAKIKEKEKAVTKSIHKATKQLISAKKILEESIDMIKNADFKSIFRKSSRVLRICLISDDLLLNQNSLKESLSQFSRRDIPMIMSISMFAEMLHKFQTKTTITQSLLMMQNEIDITSDLPIIAGIK